MRKIILLLLAIVIFNPSCKKDVRQAPVTLLSQIVTTSGSSTQTYTYQYDSSNRMIDQKMNGGGLNTTETVNVYDTSNNIIKQQTSYGYAPSDFTVYTWAYPGGSVINSTVSTITNNVPQTPQNRVLTLNSKKQVTRLDSGPGAYVLYTYDTDGNLTGEVQYATTSPNVFVRFDYTYDNKNSPYANTVGNLYQLGSNSYPHNWITETYTYYPVNGGAAQVTTYQNVFVYNADGYPVSKTTTITDYTGKVSTATLNYNYLIK